MGNLLLPVLAQEGQRVDGPLIQVAVKQFIGQTGVARGFPCDTALRCVLNTYLHEWLHTLQRDMLFDSLVTYHDDTMYPSSSPVGHTPTFRVMARHIFCQTTMHMGFYAK